MLARELGWGRAGRAGRAGRWGATVEAAGVTKDAKGIEGKRGT